MTRRAKKDNVEVVYGCCLCDLFLEPKEQQESINDEVAKVKTPEEQNWRGVREAEGA